VAVLPIGMAQISSVVFCDAEGKADFAHAVKEKKRQDYQQQVDDFREDLRHARAKIMPKARCSRTSSSMARQSHRYYPTEPLQVSNNE
jgi:hypothetical protein